MSLNTINSGRGNPTTKFSVLGDFVDVKKFSEGWVKCKNETIMLLRYGMSKIQKQKSKR